MVGGVETTDGRRKTLGTDEGDDDDELKPDSTGDDSSPISEGNPEKPGKQPVNTGSGQGFIQIINIPPYDRDKWRTNERFLKMLIELMSSSKPICWRIRNDPNNPGFQSTEIFGNVSDALATAQKGDYIYYVQNGVINVIVVGDAGNYSQQADKELTDEVLSAMQVPENPATQEPLTAEELQEAIDNGEAIEVVVNEHKEVTFKWNGAEYPVSAFTELFGEREYWLYRPAGETQYMATPIGKLIIERDAQGALTARIGRAADGKPGTGYFRPGFMGKDETHDDYDSWEEALEAFLSGEMEDIDDLFWYAPDDIDNTSGGDEFEDATEDELEHGWDNQGDDPDDEETLPGEWVNIADEFEEMGWD